MRNNDKMLYARLAHELAVGDVAAFKRLLPRTARQRSALLVSAARSNHLQIVEALVYDGTDVNRRTEGETPLEAACRGGSYEAAAYLVAHGSRPNQRPSLWQSLLSLLGERQPAAVEISALKGNDRLVELLLAAGANPHPLAKYAVVSLICVKGSILRKFQNAGAKFPPEIVSILDKKVALGDE